MIVRWGTYVRAQLTLSLDQAEPVSAARLSLRTLNAFITFENDVMVLPFVTDGEMTSRVVYRRRKQTPGMFPSAYFL